MSSPAARLHELLAPLVAEVGSDLEDVSVSQAGRRSVVRVLVDRDGGIDMDGVAEISRVVSDALDALDDAEPGLLGATYVLEVGSPGVDRPLTQPRHWRRNASRLVTATRTDGSTVTGRITTADDATVLLDVDGSPIQLAYADLARGLVQIEFNRKGPDLDETEPEDDAS